MVTAKAAPDSPQGRHSQVVDSKPSDQQRSPAGPSTIGQSSNTPPDGSCSEQPHAVAAEPPAGAAAQAAAGSIQQDPAGAQAAAAAEITADSPRTFPADSVKAEDDLPGGQQAPGGHAGEVPAKRRKWQAHIGRQVGQGWELVPISDAELAQKYAPRRTRPGDELAMDVAHHHGRVYNRAGSSLDWQPGSSESSHAQQLMSGPSGVRQSCPQPQNSSHAVHALNKMDDRPTTCARIFGLNTERPANCKHGKVNTNACYLALSPPGSDQYHCNTITLGNAKTTRADSVQHVGFVLAQNDSGD